MMMNFNWIGCRLAIASLVGCCAGLLFAGTLRAQRPYEQNHFLIRSDMAPGVAAETKRLSNPELSHHIQSVRLIVPDEARIELAGQGAFMPTDSSRVTVGMAIGPVYRFKVTNIPLNAGKELFPSVEILGKLNPPEGLESQFPVQVVVTQDDLEQALEGRMVTKVVYLENPETALPHRHREGQQPFFDVGGREDPLRAAERLGRPMAILRLGSRVPLNTGDDAGFGFYSPTPTMMEEPNSADPRHRWEKVEPELKPELESFRPLRIPDRDRQSDYRGYSPSYAASLFGTGRSRPDQSNRPRHQPVNQGSTHVESTATEKLYDRLSPVLQSPWPLSNRCASVEHFGLDRVRRCLPRSRRHGPVVQ